MRNHLAFLLLILACQCILAQELFQKGTILDSISVSNSHGETFALYLPKSFDPKKAAPILFVFEPAARGRVGVAPFVDSAEKHSLVLVCSNNSRNGSYNTNFDVAERLFSHIFRAFKVDPKKMFLTGFSGGSRLASAIATLSGQFVGVIACGAGFSPNPSQTPSLQKFLYVGICGNEDMNYQEMYNNRSYLNRLNFTNTLISFNGGHQWPPKSEINKAMDWLFLQFDQPSNNQLVNLSTKQLFEADFSHAKGLKDKEDLLLAAEHYERILSSYPKTIGLEGVQKDYNALTRTKEYKLSLKQFEVALGREQKIKQKLFSRLTADLKAPKKTNWKWWNKEVEKLNVIETGGNNQMTRMVARVKNALFATAYEVRITSPDLVQGGYLSFLEKFSETIR